jgi:hypothetical protein
MRVEEMQTHGYVITIATLIKSNIDVNSNAVTLEDVSELYRCNKKMKTFSEVQSDRGSD